MTSSRVSSGGALHTPENPVAERGPGINAGAVPGIGSGGGAGSAGGGANAPQGTEPGNATFAAAVARRVTPEDFERYFRGQTLLRPGASGVDVVVPSDSFAELMARRFRAIIEQAGAEALGRAGVTARFVVDRAAFAPRATPLPATPASPAQRPATGADDANAVGPANNPAPRPGTSGRAQRRPAFLRHRLEDFVVGESNRLAYTAALRMTEESGSPGQTLFLHGGCGVGKTHLLQGVARRWLERRPGAQVRYTTAEAFTNDFINAVRTNALAQFRDSYRRVALLCIDDVHFVANKESTQAELLHTFDALNLDGARLVLASDEHPRHIAKLSQRLVSRFLSGMVVRVDAPDPELRPRLVRALAGRRGLALQPEALALIAERAGAPGVATGPDGAPAPASAREIEGLLTQVEAASRLLSPAPAQSGPSGGADAPASAEAPRGALSAMDVRRAFAVLERHAANGPAPRRPLTAGEVVECVCLALRVDREEFAGRGRHKRVVLARAVTAVLCRRLTTQSYPEIARAMGRPNHSTVITAAQRLQAFLDAEREGRANPSDVPSDLGPEWAGVTYAGLLDRLEKDIGRQERAGG